MTTVGVTEAIATCLLSIIEPGDKVLIPAPAYLGYAPVVSLAGGKLVEIDTTTDKFVLTPEKLEQVLNETENIKAIILNYPSNPTGITYTHAQLKTLAEIIKNMKFLSFLTKFILKLIIANMYILLFRPFT